MHSESWFFVLYRVPPCHLFKKKCISVCRLFVKIMVFVFQRDRQQGWSRGPRSLFLRRCDNNGFGFTLRHFIVYPPESYTVSVRFRSDGSKCSQNVVCFNGYGKFFRDVIMSVLYLQVLQGDRRLGLRHGNTGQGQGSAALDEPMDTIFVKNVRENSSADAAGLATGKLLFCFFIWYLICPHKLAEYDFCSLKSISFPFFTCIVDTHTHTYLYILKLS